MSKELIQKNILNILEKALYKPNSLLNSLSKHVTIYEMWLPKFIRKIKNIVSSFKNYILEIVNNPEIKEIIKKIEIFKKRFFKHTILPFSTGLLVVLLPIAVLLFKEITKVEASWFDDRWRYRAPITISSNLTTTLTDYETKLDGIAVGTLYAAGKLNPDCSDIRITDINGTLLSYWIEDDNGTSDVPNCTSGTKNIWVKIPSLPNGGVTLYMYYGNKGASPYSSGEDVFTYFDDLADGGKLTEAAGGGSITYDSGNVRLSNNAAAWDMGVYSTTTFTRSADKRLITRLRTTSNSANQYSMVGFKDNGSGIDYTNMVYATYFQDSGAMYGYEDGNSRNPIAPAPTYTTNTWYDVRHDLRATGTDYYLKTASSSDWTHFYDSTYSTETPLAIGAIQYNYTSSLTVDFWYITTYLSSTPGVPTLGSEEETTSPIAYYAFDEGEGSKTYNELDVANMGATAPVVHLSMEDNDIDSHTCPDGTSVAGTCDETGGNNATAYGSMTDGDFVTGKVGLYAIDLDGSDDYLSTADANALDATNNLTIEAWVNNADNAWNGEKQTIVSKWGYASDSDFQNAANWAVFSTTGVNASSRGFQGAVFDGRYVYFVPLYNDVYHGNVARYDTAADFSTTGSWSVFNTATVNANAIGFLGGCFDGRYVYFVPYYTGTAFHGNVTRYDTLGNFSSISSWAVFNVASVNANAIGLRGCTFDGTNVYFGPYYSGTYHGYAAKYNTTTDFATAGSWTVYNLNSVDADAEGFNGVTFDGRYVYFAPYYSSNSTAYSGHMTRYDTLADFATAGSWAVYDVTAVDADAKGFLDSVFDGKYVYFIPHHNGTVYNGHVTRYDTAGDFATAGSWTVYDLNSVDADAEGYGGAAFDGRYIYLAPYYSSNAAANSGHTTRYDTLADFSTANSWKVYDVTAVDVNAKGFLGVVSDGRYLYFAPYYTGAAYHGSITRFDGLAEVSNSNIPNGSYSLEYTESPKGGQGGAPGGLTFKTAVGGSTGKIRTVTYDGDLGGGWHHVAGVYNENNISLYVDGQKVSEEIYPTTVSIANSGIQVNVGNTYTGNSFFTGKIDDLKVYANSRTPSQIYADYTLDTHGTLIPGSSGDNTTATAMWSSSGVDGNTVEFDGTDDYIRIDNTISNVKSVSFWVKPTTTSEYFIDFDGGSHYISSSSGAVSTTGFISPSVYVNGRQDAKIEAGVWNHIVVTTSTAFNATDITMGKQSTNYYQGFLDELKFYPSVLTADQRLSEYNRGASFFAGETGNASSDLILYLNMDTGYGNTLYSYSGDKAAAYISGATWNTTGKYGKSISFDGDNDYIKVTTMSSLVSGIMLGDGSDGSVTVSASKNMNTGDLGADSDDNSTYADGIAYKVSNITGSTVITTTDAVGFSLDDKVLLIDLQGTTSDNGSVGNYEILTISSISGANVTLTSAPTLDYDGTGNSYTDQKVIIQRIPQYTNVTVSSGGTITASAWDGLTTTPTGNAGFHTGIVAFMASGTVTVASGGSIHADYLGYRGGAGATTLQGGEAYGGYSCGGAGSSTVGGNGLCGGGAGGAGYGYLGGNTAYAGGTGSASFGSGGSGGYAYVHDSSFPTGGGGGGGGYGTAGGGGESMLSAAPYDGYNGAADDSGDGGDGWYSFDSAGTGGGGGGGGYLSTNSNLNDLRLGNGGGSGGDTNMGTGGAGGAGGGIVLISANTISVSGTVKSTGGDGGDSINVYQQGGGGGGGAGGSIRIQGDTVTLGTALVTAAGGAGGEGAFQYAGSRFGGAGGKGIAAAYYVTSITGTSDPAYYSEQTTIAYDTSNVNTEAPDLSVGANPFSVSLWFKHPVTEVTSSELEMLASDVGFDPTTPGWKLYMNDSEQICFAIDDDVFWGPEDSTCTTTAYNDNEWHHLVARKNASTLTMHVDGIEKASSSISNATGSLNNTVDLYIGIDSDFGKAWYGNLDEFRMFTSGLTIGEIMEEYNRMSALNIGTNMQDLRNVGAGGTSPIMYLNFDEGTDILSHDLSGNSNDGLNIGTSWIADGRFGNAVEFDGTNDYVNIDDSSSLDITDTITIEGWVYLAATKAASQYHYLIDKENLYSLYINEDETVTFYGTNLSTAALTTTQQLSLNTWYHLAATYDSAGGSNNTKIYINGVLSTQNTRTNSLGIDNKPARVGCFSNTGGACSITYGLNGKADDVRIYNYVRTPKQILQDMYGDHNAAHPVTYWAFDEGEGQIIRSSHADNLKISNSSLNGTLGVGSTSITNDPDWITTTSSCHKGDCLDFVSSNSDYIGIGTSQPSNINSISFWINPDSISGTDYVLNLDGSKTLTIVDGTVTADNLSSPTIYVNGRQKNTIPASAWSHVVVTTATAIDKDSLAVTIGKTAAGYYNGLLDEVALFNYVLTEADIKEVYNMGAIYYK